MTDVQDAGRSGAPRHLAMVVHAMLPGGAEKVASVLLNAWAARGWRVSLLTFDDGRAPSFYALDPRIEHRALAIAGDSPNPVLGAGRGIGRVLVLRRALAGLAPDLVVSVLDRTNVTTLLASRGLGFPVAVCEHTDAELAPLPRAWEWLRRATYPRTAAVVVLNARAREHFARWCRAPVRVIPNPVVVGDEPAQRPGASRHLLVSMGRFTAEKRYDLLLRAFARVAERFPDWDLLLLGDGPLRTSLLALRDELGLAARAHLPGYASAPHGVLRGADLYVCSSRIEGFPCALTEAMACGLPVISTRYHSGVTEIIEEGRSGVLVAPDDEEALATAMASLMGDAAGRARLGQGASDGVKRFGIDAVLAQWDDLFDAMRARTAA